MEFHIVAKFWRNLKRDKKIYKPVILIYAIINFSEAARAGAL